MKLAQGIGFSEKFVIHGEEPFDDYCTRLAEYWTGVEVPIYDNIIEFAPTPWRKFRALWAWKYSLAIRYIMALFLVLAGIFWGLGLMPTFFTPPNQSPALAVEDLLLSADNSLMIRDTINATAFVALASQSRTGSPSQLAMISSIRGKIELFEGNFDTAIVSLKEARQQFQALRRWDELAQAEFYLYYAYKRAGKEGEAKAQLKMLEMLVITEKHESPRTKGFYLWAEAWEEEDLERKLLKLKSAADAFAPCLCRDYLRVILQISDTETQFYMGQFTLLKEKNENLEQLIDSDTFNRKAYLASLAEIHLKLYNDAAKESEHQCEKMLQHLDDARDSYSQAEEAKVSGMSLSTTLDFKLRLINLECSYAHYARVCKPENYDSQELYTKAGAELDTILSQASNVQAMSVDLRVRAYTTQAAIATNTGDFHRAAESYRRVIEIQKERKDYVEIHRAQVNLGVLQIKKLNDAKGGKETFREAIEMARRTLGEQGAEETKNVYKKVTGKNFDE